MRKGLVLFFDVSLQRTAVVLCLSQSGRQREENIGFPPPRALFPAATGRGEEPAHETLGSPDSPSPDSWLP